MFDLKFFCFSQKQKPFQHACPWFPLNFSLFNAILIEFTGYFRSRNKPNQTLCFVWFCLFCLVFDGSGCGNSFNKGFRGPTISSESRWRRNNRDVSLHSPLGMAFVHTFRDLRCWWFAKWCMSAKNEWIVLQCIFTFNAIRSMTKVDSLNSA